MRPAAYSVSHLTGLTFPLQDLEFLPSSFFFKLYLCPFFKDLLIILMKGAIPNNLFELFCEIFLRNILLSARIRFFGTTVINKGLRRAILVFLNVLLGSYRCLALTTTDNSS